MRLNFYGQIVFSYFSQLIIEHLWTFNWEWKRNVSLVDLHLRELPKWLLRSASTRRFLTISSNCRVVLPEPPFGACFHGFPTTGLLGLLCFHTMDMVDFVVARLLIYVSRVCKYVDTAYYSFQFWQSLTLRFNFDGSRLLLSTLKIFVNLF